jgi:EAL and modified HD-GYP domain-containing signal transduction protein
MDVFVARQPIFDRNEKVFGYELLFRDGLTPVYRHTDPTAATSHIIAESPALIGVESITRGELAFVNVTRDLLIAGCTSLLPARYTVIEVLETVSADDSVIEACRAMKKAGYRIALDDFTYADRGSPLVAVADIIKVDMLRTQPEERRELVRTLSARGIQMLAEKVETQEQLAECRSHGFEYFQGYFFSRPVTLSSKIIPGIKLHYLEMLKEIQRPELDLDLIEDIIRHDVSLSYRLLRHLSMAYFGMREPIHSIRQALMTVGEREFRKWMSVLVLANLAGDHPEELVVQALVRARLCERLAPQAGMRPAADDCFLMGMLSLVDTMVGRPLEEILGHVPVADEVRSALLGDECAHLRLLEYVRAWEQGDWNGTTRLATEMHLDENRVPDLIGDALAFGRNGADATRRAA